jgi:TonB family protein
MENGTVKENVIIERTSGSLQWDQMVIAALKNWEFVALPGKGLRQDQTGVITFQFVI